MNETVTTGDLGDVSECGCGNPKCPCGPDCQCGPDCSCPPQEPEEPKKRQKKKAVILGNRKKTFEEKLDEALGIKKKK